MRQLIQQLELFRELVVGAINSKQDTGTEFNIKYYAQGTQPVLAAYPRLAIWEDTGTSKRYLIYRDSGGTAKKVELT